MKELRIMVQPNVAPSNVSFQVLHERDGIWIGPPPLGAHTALSANFRAETEQRLKSFMLGAEPKKVNDFEFKGFCAARYKGILPIAAQELLEDADKAAGAERPRLNIYSHEAFDWIPWEALYSQKMKDYLGVRFEICRLPIVESAPVSDGKPRIVRRIRHLLGKDVFDAAVNGHPALYEEWRGTFGAHVPKLLRPDGANVGATSNWPGLNELEGMEDDDIIHITCHGVKENERVMWALGSPAVLDSQRVHEGNLSMFSANQGRPLIFGNACGSAAGSDLLPGLGTFFFRRGALNVIGTFAPVRIDVAVHFAQAFYQKLLGGNGAGGTPIGKALLETRAEFHQKPDPDVSHLFYCLFGPGGTTFKAED